jgi:hypothetical protein
MKEGKEGWNEEKINQEMCSMILCLLVSILLSGINIVHILAQPVPLQIAEVLHAVKKYFLCSSSAQHIVKE